jgi:AcrR family transcriptional regulator
MPERRTNDDRAKATRAALITTARRLFEQRGYSATVTEDVVRQ